MRRREFITVLGSAAIAWPLAARAQQRAMPVVGFLRDSPAEGFGHFVAALRKGLSETGFVEGQNIAIEFGWSDGYTDRLPALAENFVRRPVSVIVASAIGAALAAKAATSTLPIVFAIANDPVAFGLVGSLIRPGGNATGVSYLTSELGGKRLGLLHELLPSVSLVAVLVNPNNPNAELFLQDVQTAAATVSVRTLVVKATSESEIDSAFAAFHQQRAGALLVANDPVFNTQRLQIVSLAASHALPAIYTTREFADAGGLISYGTNLPEVYRWAGIYAGQVLKGAKPADLPIHLPTTFELVINLKTAKAFGLDVPLTLLALADQVIE
jgi:putative tryptophan/tyrosine transport system substrate-binding protein